MELLPSRTSFRPDEPLTFEIRGLAEAATVELDRLGDTVASANVRAGARTVRLPGQAEGSYGLELRPASGRSWHGAVDVLEHPMRRPRYGFVSEFAHGRTAERAAEHARRFHLNAVQFYDWMYRHAQLLPPRDRFHDALGRELSLATVRRLVRALDNAGSLPLGYAAVYAVGVDEVERWRDALLYDGAGNAATLGDEFLWIVDPADPAWLEHFCGELRDAIAQIGFAGFHLDQYGAPQRATGADGREVDLADAFPRLLETVRAALPSATFIFNNVNDFPTWTTARAPQDAIYIEVWPPHTRLSHLAGLVERARAFGADKPIILAAYLSCFRNAPERRALAAAQLVTATIASSGGSHLLHGEEGAVLTHPYYPDHHRLGARAYETLRQWQAFVVRHGEILFDAVSVDVTRAVAGGINEELRLAGAPLTVDAEPGAVWMRVFESPRGRLIHLIDLTGQTESEWDAPKEPLRPLRGLALELKRGRPALPSVRIGQPHEPRLRSLDVSAEEDGSAVVKLPPLRGWALLWVPER